MLIAPRRKLSPVPPLAIRPFFLYTGRMSDIEWNSVPVTDEEKPTVSREDLREMARDLDPDDFDDAVRNFLDELMGDAPMDELQKGATLLLQDEVDLSPDLAAQGVEPDMDLISLLLATGADINARNAYGQPPLHLAAYYGYEEIVDTLLAAGADLRTKNAQGRFAAEVAATPTLAAKLEPPYHPDDDKPLPAEIEDADCECDGDHECTCGGGHECHCGHHHD